MTHYDIALIGSGSGNSFPGPEFAGKTIAYIDRGVGPDRVFGGTCLNVGCIPTKMFVHTADIAATPREAPRFGVAETLDGVDWPAIRNRIFGRIDAISQGGLEYRETHADNRDVTVLRGTARFTAPKTLEVVLNVGGTETVTADTIVIGAGSRPELPGHIEGLVETEPLTSDTVMRIDALPASIVILGSGVIAAEFAHILAGLGVDVTIVARSGTLLRGQDEDIAAAFTRAISDRCTVVTDFQAASARRTAEGIELRGTVDGAERTLRAAELLVATGRRPNSDLLDVAAGGIAARANGRVRVDGFQRVLGLDGEPLEGVWAFGDVSSRHQLKHVANHEMRIVRHNVLHPEDLRRSDTMPVPHGIFTAPQIAAVGMTEAEARALGREIRVARQAYAGIAFGWALEDTTGFAKIIVDAHTGEILGAHILGEQATVLIQLLVQAMSLGQTPADLARTQYWIHPALTELIENLLLQLDG